MPPIGGVPLFQLINANCFISNAVILTMNFRQTSSFSIKSHLLLCGFPIFLNMYARGNTSQPDKVRSSNFISHRCFPTTPTSSVLKIQVHFLLGSLFRFLRHKQPKPDHNVPKRPVARVRLRGVLFSRPKVNSWSALKLSVHSPFFSRETMIHLPSPTVRIQLPFCPLPLQMTLGVEGPQISLLVCVLRGEPYK